MHTPVRKNTAKSSARRSKTLAAELAEADNAVGQDGNGNGQRGNWEYREVTPSNDEGTETHLANKWGLAPEELRAMEEKSRAGYRGGTPGGSELSSLSSDSEEDEAEVAGTMVLVGKGDLDHGKLPAANLDELRIHSPPRVHPYDILEYFDEHTLALLASDAESSKEEFAVDSDSESDTEIQAALFESWDHSRAESLDAGWRASDSRINLGAVIVEIESEDDKGASTSGKNDNPHDKGKGVHSEEKGPRYEEFKQAGPSKLHPRPEKPKPKGTHQGKSKAKGSGVKVKMAREHHFEPANFRRDPSEIPGGGYYRETTVGPDGPTDSSSSSSSSSSESGDDGANSPPSSSDGSDDDGSSSSSSSSSSALLRSAKRRKRASKEKRNASSKAQKKMKRVLASVKIKSPFVYDGKPDLDTYDHWTYEVDTWAELHDLDNEMTVKIMVNFMTGKASTFFMKHVALRRKKWTVKQVYDGLFDYCFPSDFKLRLRDRLMSAKQGGSKIRDFVRDLESLSVRFPDVTERHLKQIFWSGIHQSLRWHLIGKGLDPERSSLKKMAKYATREESVQETIRREQRETNGSGQYPNWQAKNTHGKKPDSGNQNGQKPQQQKSSSDGKASDKGKERKKQGQVTSTLSKEERDRLRAEGRCFNCKDVGHDQRNCPSRQTAKGPNIKTSSVRFEEID
ncbi:hypothetical protein B0H14DRAFT_3869816 [Mycena olivaceomarginata]|nr:hypothetical protein B0H14DRAFT_3869816 [Mycena olivaceomarginata]